MPQLYSASMNLVESTEPVTLLYKAPWSWPTNMLADVGEAQEDDVSVINTEVPLFIFKLPDLAQDVSIL